MKKTNVVIASVLKPVDDTRMYEKFARTLAGQSDYHIHVIGFHAATIPTEQNITFHPIFNFSRLSVKRFIVSFKYYKKLLQLKPDIIIVNTTDLLIVTCIYKILFGTEILYDVQENYMYNSLFQKKFRRPLNYIVAYFVRLIEWITSPFIRHFILAEQTYQAELPFIGKRFTVLENKFVPPLHGLNQNRDRTRNRSIYHLLYSGTIAESYGIFEAIDLVVKLHQVDKRFHLTIIGYCADAKVFAKVKDSISPYAFIRLIGGNSLVPHSAIVAAIQVADIGLIAYQYNKSTYNKIPTKLNEYMYFDLPFIISPNVVWRAYCDPFRAYIEVDYSLVDTYRLMLDMYVNPFYNSVVSKESLIWKKEAHILTNLVEYIKTIKISKIKCKILILLAQSSKQY